MFQKYLENEQLNFQVNRFIEPYYLDEKVQTDVKRICQNIHDLEEWYLQWRTLGDQQFQEEQFGIASAYYQLADFFLAESDKRKADTYGLFKEAYYKSIAHQSIEYNRVPFHGKTLPVAIIRRPEATQWLIFHGGFNSYLEELIRLSLTYLSDVKDYNILMFEGPGQGGPLKEGLPMSYNWEETVSAVIDFFELTDVTLMGMSLGGYLALRAAAKEQRIKKVIAFDIFYSMMDAFSLNAPKEILNQLNLEDPLLQQKLNQQLPLLAKKSIDLQFKLTKGMEILGKNSPAEVLIEIQKFTLAGIEAEITQEVLLLAGTEDMYVPVERSAFLQSKLIHAAKIESVLFTNKSGGQYHCQVGDKELAFKRICDFLS